MPNRSSKKRDRPDENVLAKRLIDEIIAETEDKVVIAAVKSGKNPAAVLLGRQGGLKGGKARAEKLSGEERSQIARKAARARWSKD